MKKFQFTANTLTACGPNCPEGRTFTARYVLQDTADMKRGQHVPVVHIYAVVDEKTVKIDVPGDDQYYSDAFKAAEEAAKEAAQAQEQPQDKQPDETPEDHSQAEQPEQAQDEQPAEQAQEQAQDEQPAEQAQEQPQDEQTDETPEDHSQAEQPEQIDAEQPQAQAQEQAQEQPAPDPKQAHGPIPEKTFIGTSIKGARYEIIFDAETQRTRVIIPAEYREAARATIEKAGFYYSVPMDSWNKRLTFRAYRAAVALAAELETVLAA